MKHLLILFVSGLLSLGQSRPLAAQTAAVSIPDSSGRCQDYVRLRNGNVFRGQIMDYQPGGTLVLKTSFGQTLHFSDQMIRRVTQRCRGEKSIDRSTGSKTYHFRERGWYNLTRVALMTGENNQGENIAGLLLHHSVGYALRRPLALGLGVGVEKFDMDGGGVATYPVYAEARGYLLARRLTPFWSAGAGWAFAGRDVDDRWGYDDHWTGGWLAQAQVGYRLGNHFIVYGGLRLQQMTRRWTSFWWEVGQHGQDRILHQRLELGMGLLL